MPDADLTDDQIAILFDVGEAGAPHRDEKHHDAVAQLEARGYLRYRGANALPRYELTGLAQQVLAERGAGLNEA